MNKITYGRQTISQDDIDEVSIDVIRKGTRYQLHKMLYNIQGLGKIYRKIIYYMSVSQ